MDIEKPHSVGSIATRIVCTLVGVVLLYLISLGPAGYAYIKFPKTSQFMEGYFYPATWLKGTPLEPPLGSYVLFWLKLAGFREDSYD